jgi:hypothetical protein
MPIPNHFTEEQKAQIRAEAKPTAMKLAKEAGIDWNSLPLNETEARIVTQVNEILKK